jgi:hypothetical protein
MDQRLVAACKRGVRRRVAVGVGRTDLNGRSRLVRAVWMDEWIGPRTEGRIGGGSVLGVLAGVIDDNPLAGAAARACERNRR